MRFIFMSVCKKEVKMTPTNTPTLVENPEEKGV